MIRLLRTRIRHDVEASEARFRYLVEGSLRGIFTHDEFRFPIANQAMADILGRDTPEELIE